MSCAGAMPITIENQVYCLYLLCIKYLHITNRKVVYDKNFPS